MEKAPLESYADVGGLEQQVQEIKEAVELPLTHPELYEDIGIKPPKVSHPNKYPNVPAGMSCLPQVLSEPPEGPPPKPVLEVLCQSLNDHNPQATSAECSCPRWCYFSHHFVSIDCEVELCCRA